MSNIKLFASKKIRSVWEDKEQKWYFVVEDVIAVLTDSNDPKQYVKKMQQRDTELSKGWVQIVPTLWVDAAGGKQTSKKITIAILFFLFFLSVNSFAQIQSSDTIAIPNDTLKNYNKSLFGDSLASSFFIVIHKEVKLHKHRFIVSMYM